MEELFTLQNLATFFSLSGLEIILGIDNIIFIAIIIHSIPKSRRSKVRIFGITVAIALRILMLFGVSCVMTLTKTLFSVTHFPVTGRALLMFSGGLFLIIKAFMEFHSLITKPEDDLSNTTKKKYDIKNEYKIILQIIFIDLLLSFDSVIVAVGMVNNLYLIIPAILVAMIAMLASTKAIGNFIHSNTSIKVLGLAFVCLIGFALLFDGFGINIPKGYLYAAMFFSLIVEILNIKLRNIKNHKVRHHEKPSIT